RSAIPRCARLGGCAARDPGGGGTAVRSGCGGSVHAARTRIARDPPGARHRLDRGSGRAFRVGLVPEHDLPVDDLEDRRRLLAWPVALAVTAVAEHEGRGRGLAARVDRDDLAGARERAVPGDRLVPVAQRQDMPVLDDLRSLREEAGCGVVVVLVEGGAPGSDDALRRGRAGATAGEEGDRSERYEGARDPHASASRTSSWKWASSRSLCGSSRPLSRRPEPTPRCTDSTSCRSSRPTWSSNAISSSAFSSETSSAK